jgi:hypothetical protein
VVENVLHSLSRHGQFIKDFLDDRFAGFFPGPGFASIHFAFGFRRNQEFGGGFAAR